MPGRQTGVEVQAALPPDKRPGTHCTGGWMGPGPVWTGVENLVPTEVRNPDRPARSECSTVLC